MQEYIQFIFTLLAVINPIVCGAMLMHITAESTFQSKLRSATKVTITILIILLIAAIAGKYILNAFGVSMEAFKIIGGVIIAYIGFNMMSGKMQSSNSESIDNELMSIIMFAASPGTIAVVMTISIVQNNPVGLPITAIIAIACSMAITWLSMMFMVAVSKHINVKAQQISTRFMGMIIAAMGLQFVLVGYKTFMASANN